MDEANRHDSSELIANEFCDPVNRVNSPEKSNSPQVTSLVVSQPDANKRKIHKLSKSEESDHEDIGVY